MTDNLLVPSFIRSLNVVAQQAGFTVTVELGRPRSDYKSDVIMSTWRGGRRAWRNLDFLPRTVQRICYEGGAFVWPLSSPTVILRGFMNVEKGRIDIKTDGGPLPLSLRKQGDIEIAEYVETTAYYGTKEALIAAGICTGRQFPIDRITRRAPWSAPLKRVWCTARYPDGSYVHRIETDAALAKRTLEHEEYERRYSAAQPQEHAVAVATYTLVGGLAERITQVVTDAERDFDRSFEARERDHAAGKRLCDRVVNGIRGRAHGWCVDFSGSADQLVKAGLAHSDWFKDVGACKRILFAGREIELYRPCDGGYELSIGYTADIKRHRGGRKGGEA